MKFCLLWLLGLVFTSGCDRNPVPTLEREKSTLIAADKNLEMYLEELVPIPEIEQMGLAKINILIRNLGDSSLYYPITGEYLVCGRYDLKFNERWYHNLGEFRYIGYDSIAGGNSRSLSVYIPRDDGIPDKIDSLVFVMHFSNSPNFESRIFVEPKIAMHYK